MIWIDGYPIDAAISETHMLNSEVASDPVEKGAATSDHIRELPDEITLECIVSDTPMGAVADFRSDESNGATPSMNAYERMKFIRKRAQPVTIITSLGTFESMALENFTVPRRAEDGEALRFSAKFKLFVEVENERTVVEVATPRASKKLKRGNKPAKNPPDKPANEDSGKRQSILWKLTH